MIVPIAPNSIQETTLFKIISESDPRHGLLNLANAFIKTANPIADAIISGPFEKYTLHNRDHIKKVFHLASFIMSEKTLQLISPAECVLFLYACYLHDMGMAVTDQEYKSYLVNGAYIESIDKWTEMREALDQTREKLKNAKEEQLQTLEFEIVDLQKAALANYLRPLHATKERYKSLIQTIKSTSGRSDIFEINGQSFEPDLIAICESHNLNATTLGEIISAHEDRYPRAVAIGGFLINVQFISALLRLSDILDFDYERTPKSLFESLGIKYSNLPGAEVSLFEWQKHLSVHTIELTKDEIIVSGICKHPIIEAGIREFCQVIEHEIHDTTAILKRNNKEILDKYQLVLPPIVRANLRSDGYLFMNLALKLDESAVMSLLMGNRLYSSSLVAARELIQNGVDACLVRLALLGDSNYKPAVAVTIEENKIDKSVWLIVKDNGIGMDEYVLKHHFFRVGSSYYSSPEYKRLYKNSTTAIPAITSKFGIGFLSTFMLGNEIEINTKKVYPGGGMSRGKKIYVERMGALAFVQEDETVETGTVVKVQLNMETYLKDPEAIEKFILANIIRPKVSVEFVAGRRSSRIAASTFYNLNILEKSEVRIYGLEIIELDINDPSGIEGKVFLIMYKNDDGKLSHKYDQRIIEITTGTASKTMIKVNPKFLFSDFEGNRITVAGFKMSFSNLGKLFRSNKNRIAVIYDLDFSPNTEVEFNVSRTKILDDSYVLRKKLRGAIIARIEQKYGFESFDKLTAHLLNIGSETNAFDIDIDELKKRIERSDKSGEIVIDQSLLDRVEQALPKDVWNQSIHGTIASDLGISRSQAYKAISTLIVTGKVKNPNSKETSA